MRPIVLALAVLATASLSALALTDADLTPSEQQLLASVKTNNPADAPNFMIARAYVRMAQAALKDPSAALNFHSKPAGFSVRYLLPGDAETINQAVTANIAALAKKLWRPG